MRIIKNARLTAVAGPAPETVLSPLQIFTARMRVNGRRAKQFLLCMENELAIIHLHEVAPYATWFVQHDHGKGEHVHAVLNYGEAL